MEKTTDIDKIKKELKLTDENIKKLKMNIYD